MTAMRTMMEAPPKETEGVTSLWPRFEEDEVAAAADVLRSGRVNGLVHGEHTEAFAREFADYCGAPFGLSVANGTVALELALRALDIGPGDEVIVPARSFYATASAVVAVGAMPAFADICEDSQNIDPSSIERLLCRRTKAVICVHLAGFPCDMARITALSAEHGLFVIEDCAQAHGASTSDRRAGAWGDISAFSFCTDKIMSTGGEGGMLLFQDEGRFVRSREYKDHGKNFAKMKAAGGAPGQFRYIHDGPGTNFRLTELQAAIGRRQLAKLPDWLETRQRNARILMERLRGVPGIILPAPGDGVRHAWYKFYLRLCDPAEEPVEVYRSRLITRLHARGVPAGTGSCPDMSQEAAFAELPVRRDGILARANDLGRRSLMFPVDHTLDPGAMHRIADALIDVLTEDR